MMGDVNESLPTGDALADALLKLARKYDLDAALVATLNRAAAALRSSPTVKESLQVEKPGEYLTIVLRVIDGIKPTILDDVEKAVGDGAVLAWTGWCHAAYQRDAALRSRQQAADGVANGALTDIPMACHRLNDAAWMMVQTLPKLSGDVFNNLKPALRLAIQHYNAAILAAKEPHP